MADVDRATIEAGIPGMILMENAAQLVVEYIAAHFSPVGEQRIVVVCGKGNNGGDGLAIARQLHVRFKPCTVLRGVSDLRSGGTARRCGAELSRCCARRGCREYRDFGPEMRIREASWSTPFSEPDWSAAATGLALDGDSRDQLVVPFRPKVVAVDIPSGLSGRKRRTPPGEYMHADATVTFTAPKVCHAMPPACDRMGDLVIASIGSPSSIHENDERIQLALITPREQSRRCSRHARGIRTRASSGMFSSWPARATSPARRPWRGFRRCAPEPAW